MVSERRQGQALNDPVYRSRVMWNSLYRESLNGKGHGLDSLRAAVERVSVTTPGDSKNDNKMPCL
jgi:hypothetical protein